MELQASLSQLVGSWLNEYKKDKFHNRTNYISGAQVHLSGNNALAKALNQRRTVAMLRVTGSNSYAHYILAMQFKNGWLYAFDPHAVPGAKSKPQCYEFLPEATGQMPNLRIHREWLDKQSTKGRYRLGALKGREALLLQRVAV
jgi:hypothetical protein